MARACSCLAPPPPEEALETAAAVFEARPFGMSGDSRQARYRFEVDRVWKGDVEPRVEITTALHSATCGRSYQMGTRYVVYAQRDQSGQLTDNLCSRTRTSRGAAEDLELLGAGRPPLDPATLPSSADAGTQPTEPPRIQPTEPEPPPTAPGSRGCAVEKPHTTQIMGWLALLGLAVAIARRRAVGSQTPR
ncbi:MAG: hypothetical protein KDK70_29215 [Myxococcales bacterium]|nr:hypothetical protein [Myxococcales bacterium]